MKFRGAEAIVETIEWNGQTVISKIRNKRGYRHPSLEKRLVVERLRSESRIMERLISQGVPVPAIFSVNTSDNSIFMEFIEGQTLERALRGKDFKKHLIQTAHLLSRIHSLNVVHGDPTTSNFLVNDKIYAIDFGLSREIPKDERGEKEPMREFAGTVQYMAPEVYID